MMTRKQFDEVFDRQQLLQGRVNRGLASPDEKRECEELLDALVAHWKEERARGCDDLVYVIRVPARPWREDPDGSTYRDWLREISEAIERRVRATNSEYRQSEPIESCFDEAADDIGMVAATFFATRSEIGRALCTRLADSCFVVSDEQLDSLPEVYRKEQPKDREARARWLRGLDDDKQRDDGDATP
jgi:hypothetical protein